MMHIYGYCIRGPVLPIFPGRKNNYANPSLVMPYASTEIAEKTANPNNVFSRLHVNRCICRYIGIIRFLRFSTFSRPL